MRRIVKFVLGIVVLIVGVRVCTYVLVQPSDLFADADVARVDSVLSHIERPALDRYGYVIDTLDRRVLHRLLRESQYDSLEALLDERWDSTRADIRHEARLTHAYEAFVQGSPAIEASMTRWVEARPNSASARVAMASYRWGLALEARGGRVAIATSDASFADADAQASRGLAAVDEALRLAPDHLHAYVMRLELMRMLRSPDQEAFRSTLESALAAHPTSFQLRWTILGLMQPRWGGSLELMRQFSATAEQFTPQNEKLRAIGGAVAQEQAFMQRSDLDSAVVLLDQASGSGEHYMLHLAYGDLYLRHRNYVNALAAYERALSLSPQGRSALEGRAEALIYIGSLVIDSAARERIWGEAEKTLGLLRQLRPPQLDLEGLSQKLDYAREICGSGTPPCLPGA